MMLNKKTPVKVPNTLATMSNKSKLLVVVKLYCAISRARPYKDTDKNIFMKFFFRLLSNAFFPKAQSDKKARPA